MKKYVRASFDVNDFEGKIKALKRDRRTAASLDPDTTTYEDLKSIPWECGRYPLIWIKNREQNGVSVEECIDDLIDGFMSHIDDLKENISARDKYRTQVYALKPNLSSYLDDNYNVIDQTEDSWKIEPPAGATHKDCIAFVDDIVDFVNGRYWGTGRGGSWTVWDLLSDGKVQLKAGWTRDDKWYVEILGGNI